MRRVWIAVLAVIMLVAAQSTGARDVIQGSDCVIQAGTVYEGNVFALCRTFVNNGTIKGDLLLATFSAEINGPVEGNIYTLAGQLDLHNDVGRDLVFAGPVLRIHPTANFEDNLSNLISLSLSTEILDGVKIPGSVLSFSYQLVTSGEIGRDINFLGSALRVDGEVGGNIDASVGDAATGNPSQLQTLLVPFRFDSQLIPPGLIVTGDAAIGGTITYSSTSPGEVPGLLEDQTRFNQIITAPNFTQIDEGEESNTVWFTGYISQAVREFVTLAGIGLIGIFFIPRSIQSPLVHLRVRPLSSLGTGVLTFILSFAIWLVVLLILLLTIGLFLALRLTDLVYVSLMTMGLLNVGAASAFYFIAIYVSRIIVCLFFGRILVRITLGDDGTPRMLYFNLLVGVAIFALLAFLPFIGSVANALALALGLGAIFQTLLHSRDATRRQLAPAAVPVGNRDLRQIPPPPMVEEKPGYPGMENLPEGFRWWSDDD